MQEQIDYLWDRCLSQLSKRVKKNSFYTWLKPTEAEYIDAQTFNILVPNNFAANWLEEKYRHTICEVLAEISSQTWNFGFKIRKIPVQAEMFTPEADTEADFPSRPRRPTRRVRRTAPVRTA